MARRKADTSEDHQAISRWIIEGLERIDQTQVALAKHMGIPASRLSEGLKGKRSFKAIEISRASVFLGSPVPRSTTPATHTQVRAVEIVGAINHNWQQDGAPAATGNGKDKRRLIGAVSSVGYPASEQIAFDCDITDAKADLKAGDIIFAVPIEKAARVATSNLVVIARRFSGLENFAIARISDENSRDYALISAPLQAKHEAKIIALVIATHRARV